MKKKNNIHIQSLEKDMNAAAARSRIAIEKVLEQTAEKLKEIRETGNNAFDSVNGLLHDNEMSPGMLTPFKPAYRKKMDLAQKVADNIVEPYRESMRLSAEFSSRFMEMVGANDFMNGKASEQLANLVSEHLLKSSDHSAAAMLNLFEAYSHYFRFSIKFNRNFANLALTEMIKLMKIQNKNSSIFSAGNMVADWWNR